MSEYQRAVADLIRLPALCKTINTSSLDVLNNYSLTLQEKQRLCSIACQRSMAVNCMLYRASRLVGITRRLPITVELLGPALREIFDAYLVAYPHAEAEFDNEARCFARYIASQFDELEFHVNVSNKTIRSLLADEIFSLKE